VRRPVRLALAGAAAALALGALSLTHLPGRRGCVVSAVVTTFTDDRLKARAVAPDDAVIDRAATLAALLAPGDDAGRFDPARGVEVEAWVADVKVGGWEGVNCFALGAADRDTHIDLARAPNAPDTAHVVAEVTPAWRDVMRARGVDWSTAALRAALVGRRVRVRGWLYWDGHHADGSAHVDPADARGEPNWRATAWEIHPVTSIELLPF